MQRTLKEKGNSANARQVAQRRSSRYPAQGGVAALLDNSPRMIAQRKKLQSLFGGAAQLQEERASKSNSTGMPDKLKSGIEALSGMSMDHIKVHYNSSQPAQLDALAYAQGSDIHIAPGQEQYLPHEAWHVVQQAQGKVQPTMQMKGGVAVNDDKGLEQEADVMGGKALQMMRKGMNLGSANSGVENHGSAGCIVQRHGPGFQNSKYVEGDGAHLDRHLNDWQKYFDDVQTVDDVRKIAKELFGNTAQEDWNNKGGTYAVDHSYRGQTVRLVWGLGGIVSCFVVEPKESKSKKKVEDNSEQQNQQQYREYRGYYWTTDWTAWWDPEKNMWRTRFEMQTDGRYYDWYKLQWC